ncbi:MAG TPA: type I-C CRISPR-associated protein Cas5c [Thermoanaerobaculia bacterium]|jgi:CRISPR-associated protein Cas5d|nr:type I-C CRISPR-associated protein Cas5c [Thermoanaerobaculia bacterium]
MRTTHQSKMFAIRMTADRACFTNPAFTAERATYDVPTPVALEGTLKAIFWRRGLRWNVAKISILSGIKHANLRRNEVQRFGQIEEDTRNAFTQRMTTYLRDVDYRIDCYIDLEEKDRPATDIVKGEAMFQRYMDHGKQFHQPYLGCREFVCDVRWASEGDPDPIDESRDLGRMVFGYVWSGDRRQTILEYDARMVRGVIRVPAYDDVLREHQKRVRAHLRTLEAG